MLYNWVASIFCVGGKSPALKRLTIVFIFEHNSMINIFVWDLICSV